MRVKRRQSYPDHQLMIQKHAHRIQQSTGVEFGELEAQGNLIFVQAQEDYKPSKGAKFSTWLYRRLVSRLGRFAYKQISVPLPPVQPDAFHNHNPRRCLIWKETLENFSKEAKEVVQLVLDAPRELAEIGADKPAGPTRTILREHLRRCGWPLKMIKAVFGEIAEVLKDL